MINKQIIRESLIELAEINSLEVGLYDEKGSLFISSKNHKQLDSEKIASLAEKCTSGQLFAKGGKLVCKIAQDKGSGYLLVSDDAKADEKVLRTLASHLGSMFRLTEDKPDKASTLKAIMTGELKGNDIYAKASRAKLDTDRRRVLFLVETKEDSIQTALEILKSMYVTASGYLVMPLGKDSLMVVKELKDCEGKEDVAELAEEMVSILNTEAMVSARVAYGETAISLDDVRRSYEQALAAMEVGSIFYSQLNVLAYEKLGIGLLIYQLPKDMCKRYVSDILSNSNMRDIDKETLDIVNSFFDNNLNISETSRQLYRNRNALTARIERLQEQTGLDMRNFHDAVSFDIAMMINEYLEYLDR